MDTHSPRGRLCFGSRLLCSSLHRLPPRPTPPCLSSKHQLPLPILLQDDSALAACYFDAAVRNRTAKINDFFLKYLTRELSSGVLLPSRRRGC